MEKKPHRCPHESCNSSFNRPYRLAQHLLIHKNSKAYSCNEVNCSKSYTNKSHLDRHINSAHRPPERDVLYSCPTCLKMYANRQNLKRHINLKHTENSCSKLLFWCDICKKDFKKKNQLNAHMYQHTGIKSFSCEICSQDFVSLYDKRQHMRNHKTYNCDVCDIKFDRWSKYLKHRKSDHSQKEFICNECGRTFKQRVHIVRHMKKHSVAQHSNKKFPCPYENCQRVYSRNSNLKQHILIKHVKMSHECSVCKAQLCTKAKLNNHLKLHDTAEPKETLPKTKATGRKERKDKGVPKVSIALKLAGIKDFEDKEPVVPNLIENCVS